MEESLNGARTMASPPSQQKLRPSSYLVEAEPDREWERGGQQTMVSYDSESAGSKEPMS